MLAELPIRKHAQNGKQVGPTLHFIDHYQILQAFERRLGLVQTSKADGVFQIKIASRIGDDQFASEGRFSTLARANQRDDSAALGSMTSTFFGGAAKVDVARVQSARVSRAWRLDFMGVGAWGGFLKRWLKSRARGAW